MADKWGAWVIVLALVLVGGLAVGAWAYFRDDGISCRDWQEAWDVSLRPGSSPSSDPKGAAR